MAKKRLHHLPWTCWVLLICFLSFLPGDRLPQISWNFISLDKIAHFGMYAVLSVLLLIGFTKNNPNLSRLRLYLLLTLAGLSFGVMVELVQGNFIYRRYFSIPDIIANSFGTVFGILAVAVLKRKNSNRSAG